MITTMMMGVIIVIIILVLLMILVLKVTKKYYITLYWCQNVRDSMVEKKGQKIRAGPSPPFLGNARKKTFFCGRCSLTTLSNVRLVALVVLVSARVKQMCQPALPKQSTISHLLQCNVLPRLCKRVKKISLDLVLHWNKLLLSSSIIPE